MAGERQDARATTFQFIEEVYLQPQRYLRYAKENRSKFGPLRKKIFEGRRIFCVKLFEERVESAKGGSSAADIRFRPNLSIPLLLSIYSMAII